MNLSHTYYRKKFYEYIHNKEEFKKYIETLDIDELLNLNFIIDYHIYDLYKELKCKVREQGTIIKPYLSLEQRQFILEHNSNIDFSDLHDGDIIHIPFSLYEQKITLLILGFNDNVVIGTSLELLNKFLPDRLTNDILEFYKDIKNRGSFITDDCDVLVFKNAKVMSKPLSSSSSFSSTFNNQELCYNKSFNQNINEKIPFLFNPISTIKHNSGPITEIALFTDYSNHSKKTYFAAGCCVNQPDVQKDNFLTSILEDGYVNVLSTHNESTNENDENYSTISDIKISNNGKYIYTSGFDKRIEVWDRKNFRREYIIGQQHRANINRLAVHPEYYDKEIVASCSDDGVVILYSERCDSDNDSELSYSSSNSNDVWHQNKIGYPSSYSACDITFGIKNCNNLLFTGFECELGGIIKLYNIDICQVVYKRKFPGRISCISLSPTGKLLTCGTFIGSEEDYSNNGIYLIDTENQQYIKNIDTPQNDINVILWSRDGQKIVSCSTDDCAIIYDIRYLSTPLITLKHEGYLEPDSCGIVSAKWMNKTNILITGGTDSTLRFWDIRRGEPEVHNIFLDDSSVSSISLTDDDEWLCAGTNNGCVKLHSIDRDYISLWN
ncbi:WD40 repeat-like protein [Piromyces finnis]|uniref:WD40 repeat-like protein n=1 Tax=Piromyces finnis TaxID=1754191 RepID=A0A1Y1UXS9_9FUNG|nr:WD40 repeat-like protein [Piromyces finnis]|eukprot:ORX42987.1 WD40 repeat-like protein [Piromyces finnis]